MTIIVEVRERETEEKKWGKIRDCLDIFRLNITEENFDWFIY